MSYLSLCYSELQIIIATYFTIYLIICFQIGFDLITVSTISIFHYVYLLHVIVSLIFKKFYIFIMKLILANIHVHIRSGERGGNKGSST